MKNQWIEYNKQYYKSNCECFWRSEFNQPGTIIEIENGDRLLIGDINTNCGTGWSCPEFLATTIIKRYMILDLEFTNH